MKYTRTVTSRSIVIIIAALCLFVWTVPAYAATIQLPKGTEVKLRFTPGMKISSGELTKGVPLIVFLAEPIQIGGKTIVEEGAQGTATVLDVKKNGRGGSPGYIKIGFTELEPKGDYKTVDNAKIKLAGEFDNTGSGKKLLSYLFIFGLFIKGSQGEIDTNRVYTAIVAESIILESK